MIHRNDTSRQRSRTRVNLLGNRRVNLRRRTVRSKSSEHTTLVGPTKYLCDEDAVAGSAAKRGRSANSEITGQSSLLLQPPKKTQGRNAATAHGAVQDAIKTTAAGSCQRKERRRRGDPGGQRGMSRNSSRACR
jgi:hypothetical protein